ncbi:MAG: 2-phosphosulfolactate phosphatase [Desulfobacterales bacterium]|nr:2-phosphosulfolactate phosphatase [Desulfobacterales bacterium]
MKIRTVDFVEGAKKAEGVAVVIDVFRAFSVACYAFAGGAERIFPVGEIDAAFKLKAKLPDAVLVGERGGKKLEGFDLGNSPTEIQGADLTGKTLIHTTHAGTQGLVNVRHATMILTGAFVNARATACYIQSLAPKIITLVRMGLEARSRSDEDDLCAEYFTFLLGCGSFDDASVKPTLRASKFSERFFDPKQPWSPESDFDLCLMVDRFDFAIQAETSTTGNLCLRRVLR